MKVEISTTKDYSQDELDVMISEFGELGFEASADTSLFKKALEVPPDVMLFLIFFLGLAAGNYVAGFFQKMGEDTWDLVKKGVIRLFHKKKDGLNPRIILKIPVSEDDFILGYIVEEDEEEVKKALNSLPVFLEKSKLKIEDVSYFIPIYYDITEGWHLPYVLDDKQG